MILYMPCVIKADGIFKMWYVGSSDHGRAPAFIHLGYASLRSDDGLRWEQEEDAVRYGGIWVRGAAGLRGGGPELAVHVVRTAAYTWDVEVTDG